MKSVSDIHRSAVNLAYALALPERRPYELMRDQIVQERGYEYYRTLYRLALKKLCNPNNRW